MEGFRQGACVGDVADEYFRALRGERLQMRCVSTNDANFLPAGKKIFRDYVSSVTACSKNDVIFDPPFQHWMRRVAFGLTQKNSATRLGV